MSYNKEHFQAEEVAVLNSELSNLIKKHDLILDYLKEFLQATNGCKQIKNCYCFIELAIKIRLNLEAASDLMPKLYEDYRFKTSLNIIYRSILDDLINISYLSLFILLKDDPLQESLENELNILHKEFLNGSSVGIDADYELSIVIHELLGEDLPPVEEYRQQMINENPELYENGVQKNNKKIRETSHPEFQELLKNTNGASFITENKKLELIKLKDPVFALALTGLYKYLSQYQHYSPKMHEFLLSSIDLDLVVYNKTLFQVLYTLEIYLKFIVTAKPEYFKKYFKELMVNITSIN